MFLLTLTPPVTRGCLHLLPEGYHNSQSSLLSWTFLSFPSSSPARPRDGNSSVATNPRFPAFSFYGSRHPDHNFVINLFTYKSSSNDPDLFFYCCSITIVPIFPLTLPCPTNPPPPTFNPPHCLCPWGLYTFLDWTLPLLSSVIEMIPI